MKKLLTIFLAIMVVFSLVACTPKQVDEEGIITVVVMQETPLTYSVKLEDVDLSEGALSVLKYLNTEKGMPLEYSTSEYGAMINKIGGITADNKTGFISVFTSVEKDWDVTEYCQTREYEGVTVKSSAVGVSSMSVVKGMVIYFCYISL